MCGSREEGGRGAGPPPREKSQSYRVSCQYCHSMLGHHRPASVTKTRFKWYLEPPLIINLKKK